MKAARLFGVGDLRVVDLPVPEIGDQDVLLKVRSAGVCGSDIARVMQVGAQRMPVTIGHEFSAEIARVGNQVRGWSEGDRVAAIPLLPCRECYWCRRGQFQLCPTYDYLGSRRDGGMAEYVAIPALNLFRVPDSLTFEEAAIVEPASVGLHGLWSGSCRVGEAVVFYGAGPIGLLMVQWARLMGAGQIIAVDIFDEKLELARQMGATDTINSRRTDPVAGVKTATNGLGGALVVESAGTQQTQIQAIQSTTRQGTTILLGISDDRLELPAGVVNQILRQELTVKGTWNSNSLPFPGEEWIQSAQHIARGALRAEPIISHRCEIAEAPRVFQMLVKRETPFNKVMFNF
jgi:L-iditol 2-dehydrogenase